MDHEILNREDRRRYSLSEHELKRRWKAVRERMAAKGISHLVIQSQQRFVGGYFRWFTDLPGNNYHITAVFPLDEDYEPALDSKVADIKQCTLAGDADHILAARFLRRFIGERPWLHVDLSASSCEDGLGAIGTHLTGFGVAWALTLLAAPDRG